jgi:hypothetical protein
MKYNVGDIFVSTSRGVITILDIIETTDKTADKIYCCKVYDKKEVKDRTEKIQEYLFNMYVKCEIYKHYPVVK